MGLNQTFPSSTILHYYFWETLYELVGQLLRSHYQKASQKTNQ